MDPPTDPGKGQEKSSEEGSNLSPSSKGRQRKKNSKYLDYETEDTNSVQSAPQKTPRKSAGGRGRAASKKCPAKDATHKSADGEECDADLTPQGPDGNISEEAPRRRGRPRKNSSKNTPARKTPAKKTPSRKTPTADGGLPAGEGGDANNVLQENGAPKRKYVRKRPAQEVEPATEPPCKKAQGEPQIEPDEEVQPGGRRRRGAAIAALRYLHILAKEVLSHPSDEADSRPGADSDVSHSEPEPVTGGKSLKVNRGRKGVKRKRGDYDSDAAEDEDFIPNAEEEEEEEEEEEVEENEEEKEEEEEAEDLDLDFRTPGKSRANYTINRTSTGPYFKSTNGLHFNTMRTVWDAAETTKKFREEHLSSWVFPTWLPSINDWHLVPQSDLEKYLPQELQSVAFKVSRVGVRDDEPLQRLSRFTSVPADPNRWDMLLFAGGPVWAMEWCPTPDGAPVTQYVALACHRGMDDQHYVNKMYGGPALIQLWDVGKLECNNRPDSQPILVYGLAQDKGFIWHLKWCPAGGWESPTCGTNAPLLPRLGLLAVATSNGVVTIYSLPHPDALNTNKKQDNCGSQQLPIYKAQGVVTLKLGSFNAPRHERSGQILSMDWLPEKPHNIIAIGFYDGIVGLWDLTTKSTLLRVREPDRSLSLLPYRCLLAHDHAVRAVAFCPSSRYLLVTAGEDRYVKTWDLRRPYNPITALKRCLTNEIYWPLNASGFMLAQDNSYASIGSHGVHYFDLNQRSYFAIPRTATVWSISYTDWLNSVLTSDAFGEVIFAVLPHICYTPQYVKRTMERRFPVYLSSRVPYETTTGEMEGAEEAEGAVEEQEGGETEQSEAAPEGVNGNNNESRRDGGRARKGQFAPLRFQTYKDAVKKYYIQLTDNNMGTFTGCEKRAVWKHMKSTEVKAKIHIDEFPLAALHKVRFSPNMCSHTWVVSGGRTGLVRLLCLKGMNSTPVNSKSESKAEFKVPLDSVKELEQTVRTTSDDL